MINLPCYFGATTDQPPKSYLQLSSEWIVIDGVEMPISLYSEYEGNLVIVAKTKDTPPDDDDLVVVPNTVNRTPYDYMLTFYRFVHETERTNIIGFICGFYHPFNRLVSRESVEGQP